VSFCHSRRLGRCAWALGKAAYRYADQVVGKRKRWQRDCPGVGQMPLSVGILRRSRPDGGGGHGFVLGRVLTC
jgi:hypothetical protein